ncbi:hypothetical protein [Micromonospora sp. DT227]|uniref:hypothetical protein n=1 Tax=Micromonospora sp. DT227 TaxID=3393433 RepID=UPI003CEBF0F7
MPFSDWQTIRKGQHDQATVAVDFGPARFRRLFARLDTGGAVVGPTFAAPGDDAMRATDPARLVRDWLDDLAEGSLRTRVVVGYCAGAAMTLALADALTRAGGTAPAVVLLDPVVSGLDVLLSYYSSSVHTFAEILPGDERAAWISTAQQALPSVSPSRSGPDAADLVRAMAVLCDAYSGMVSSVVDRMGIGAPQATYFTNRFGGLMSYLVVNARAGLDPLPSGRPPVVVVSREHEPPPMLSADLERLSVDQAGLLADPGVADALARVSPDRWPGVPS